MKLIIDKDHFLSRLDKLIKFIPENPVIPIHSMFLFNVEKELLTVYSYDGEIQASINISVECKESGGICIPGKLLYATFKLLREPMVSMVISGTKITITCGNGKYNISGTPASDFFIMPDIANPPYQLSITGKMFTETLSMAGLLVNKNNVHTPLTGICIKLDKLRLSITAGCNFYMSRILARPRSITNWEEVIIPVTAVKKLCKMIDDGDIVEVMHNYSKLIVQTEHAKVILSPIDAKYPATDKFFDNKIGEDVIINNFEMQDLLKRVKLYSSENNSYAINIEIKDRNILVSAIDEYANNTGEETATIKQDKPVTSPISVGLNCENFIDVLENINEQEFIFTYPGVDNRPVFLEPYLGGADTDVASQFIIMPMKVL